MHCSFGLISGAVVEYVCCFNAKILVQNEAGPTNFDWLEWLRKFFLRPSLICEFLFYYPSDLGVIIPC